MRFVKKMTARRLITMREDLQEAKRQFLKDHGWKEECGHPGSQWLWIHENIKGKQYRCSQDTAVSIQHDLFFD